MSQAKDVTAEQTVEQNKNITASVSSSKENTSQGLVVNRIRLKYCAVVDCHHLLFI